MPWFRFQPVLALLCLLLACRGTTPETSLPGRGDDTGRIVVYRDTWGVPHIYAPTVEDGLYAVGWAQAQDRPEQLLLNVLMGAGEFASVVGESGVGVDLRSHLFDHVGVAKGGWDKLPAELRLGVEAFSQGINDYYLHHPDDVPSWWRGRQVDPATLLASSRMFLYNWSIDEAYGDLRRGGVDPGFDAAQRGSNQFAIAPSRSAEGAAILAIDPHLSWYGPSRFWEMRVHAGDWHGSGVTRPGAPYIGLGHNRYLAWAMTTGGPDTADVYELTLKPGDPLRYLYEGEWKEMTERRISLEVAGSQPQEHTLLYSHHGPIIALHGERAWAARIAYHDVATSLEAAWDLNLGKDYTWAQKAMATLTVFPQNVMVADTSGNIYYQRTGRVPRRGDGLDASVPLDGSIAATEWQGFHPATDHLQVVNPPQGYMQNCNIPPDAMMVGSPFSLASGETRPYLYSSRAYGPERSGWINERGARALELLTRDSSVTAQEAMAFINDTHPYGAQRWLQALRRAHESHGGGYRDDPHYQAAMEDVLAWDGELARDSRGALKYSYWREQLVSDHGREAVAEMAAAIDDFYAIVEGREAKPLQVSGDVESRLVSSFAGAMSGLVEKYGSLDATYGDRFRVGRGEKSWPVGGGGPAGTRTLRSMGYTPEREDATRWGRSGQTSTQVVVLTSPPRSWIYLPLGQSDRPDSPHYSDQAEKLFSERTLKPSWWLPEDLKDHIESRSVLERSRDPEAPQTSG